MQLKKSPYSLISILVQILIWFVFALSLLLYLPLNNDIIIPVQLWVKQGIILLMLVAAFYLNSLVLVPRFLLAGRTPVYFVFIILTIGVIVFVNNKADDLLNLGRLMDAAFHHRGPPRSQHEHNNHFDTLYITIAALVLGISTSITTIQKWQRDRQVHQALEQEKTSSELSFLKAQINPHFFFNTLNNIYALTIIDVESSRVAIHKLSRMMRYVLYDTQQTYTRLNQEIDFLKDYISLMQLRLTESVKLEFVVPVEIADFQVAPMIFLPFIENAFKHGVSATRPSHISITIVQEQKRVVLRVKNLIHNEKSMSLEATNGIGLVNTKRRLDLIYDHKYKLVVNELTAENEYDVELSLDLS